MATEEETELRDLVAQTLENNGVLSKIRAQLRASVFLALEEQELAQEKIPFINKSLKEFLKTSEGSLVACLVREFLEFFELDFTLSVFDPETYHGKDYDYGGRNKLIQDLKIKSLNGRKGPLLAQILQLVRVTPKDNSDVAVKEEPTTVRTVESKSEASHSTVESNPPVTSKPAVNPDPFETKLSNLRDSSSKQKSLAENAEKRVTTPSTVEDGSLKEKDTSESKPPEKASTIEVFDSAFLALRNLPPLLNTTQPKEKDWKSILNGLEENTYEEDFQSTASGSVVGKSDSEEIEEELASGIEDLLSNASGVDELTVDATVSNVSGLADYMENV